MSLSVSYQKLNNGVDATSIKEVTQQIFNRANSKNSFISNVDLTKFNRASLGTDLYSGNIDSKTARQIAMNNSGMQVNLSANALNSLKYLNSQASQSIFKAVEGKVTIEAKEQVIDNKMKSTSLPSFGRLTESADLDSDKKGSNPFYHGELLNVKKQNEEDKKEEISLNIFA